MKKNKKKDKVMKKSNFMQGAFVATLGIVITKILGVLYVIPFYAIIGEKGGALYGYAYTFYLIFMALSTAGIPLAISKLTSEYQTLGYYDAKKHAFNIARIIAAVLGAICFIILFVFAPDLARAILGDLKGGNTISDVAFVIRVISTAIIIVPTLSVYRGFFEGHKYITPTAISQVLEQVVRVCIIVIGSYMVLKVFNGGLTNAVGVAVFAATAGSIASYFYLLFKKKKNNELFEIEEKKNKEPYISTKAIFKKLVIYAFPLIMIDIFKSLYSLVDTVTVVRTLGPIYGTKNAESIMSILSTWAAKFNMIIVSVGSGMIVSLTPNITSSLVIGDLDDVREKINQSMQVLGILIIPMTVGLSFLSQPVYTLFYGKSHFGPAVFSFNIYAALFLSFFTVMITVTQVLKNYKTVFISLFSGVILKSVLNIPLMHLFNKLGEAYYGCIIATIIGYLASFIICLISLHVTYKVNYKDTFIQLIKIIIGTIIMVLSLMIVKLIVPISSNSRVLNLAIIIIYTLIGIIVYYIYASRTGLINHVLGSNFTSKIKRRLKREKAK